MLECVCSAVINSEFLRMASLEALKHAQSLTNCNALQCFEDVVIPPTATLTTVPLELIVIPLVLSVAYVTRPRPSKLK